MTARRFAEARQLAELDSLTGLYNRRSFHDALQREVARARRYERRLALVVLDLDDFKRVNDTAGHLAGDAVLAEVGRRILSLVRATDIACRFGGDEFAVILPESTRADAELLADRIVRAIAAKPVEKVGPIARVGGHRRAVVRRTPAPTSSTARTWPSTGPRTAGKTAQSRRAEQLPRCREAGLGPASLTCTLASERSRQSSSGESISGISSPRRRRARHSSHRARRRT